MLVELSVSNFAVIEQLNLSLSPGFNVLTGETGAGKSLVIDAVAAVLGGRVDSELVRAGTDRARVEGVFLFPTAGGDENRRGVEEFLEEHGLGGDQGTIFLGREIVRGGRHVARVNGRAVPLGLLQEIGCALVDLHGQSEHLSLLRTATHIDYLDRYAGLAAMRRAVADQYTALQRLRREIQSLARDEREMARHADLLRYQVEEIAAAKLRPGEEEELEAERVVLVNAERLAATAGMAYSLVAEGTPEQRSILDALGEVQVAIAEIARLDGRMVARQQQVESLFYQLQETAAELRAYRDAIEYDPVRLEAVEERIDLLHRLKHKYGDSIEEVLRYGERARQELESIVHHAERLEELARQEVALLREFGQAAGILSEARWKAAHQLATVVEEELADLNMAGVRFSVALGHEESPSGIPLDDGRRYAFNATGIDQVEFHVATNVGEPLMPLARVASGGETSRLMLALKTVLSQADAIPTLIFDEIDAGIGGRSGQVVGRKLWNLARRHQVICVTHLPQIACFGDAHYRIWKEVVGDRTVVAAQALNQEERVEELAAMLGGPVRSDTLRQNARELLAGAEEWKLSRIDGAVPAAG